MIFEGGTASEPARLRERAAQVLWQALTISERSARKRLLQQSFELLREAHVADDAAHPATVSGHGLLFQRLIDPALLRPEADPPAPARPAPAQASAGPASGP